jgi:hypothetical protein
VTLCRKPFSGITLISKNKKGSELKMFRGHSAKHYPKIKEIFIGFDRVTVTLKDKSRIIYKNEDVE